MAMASSAGAEGRGRMGGWEDERIPIVHNEDAIYILSKERERRNGETGISGETEE